MRRAEVSIFNVLHIIGRDDQAEIGKRFYAATGKSSENQCLEAKPARLFQPLDHVGGIAAAGYCEDHFPFFRNACKLFGKNVFICEVVGKRGDKRHIVRQSYGAQALAARSDCSFPDITRKMGSERGTSAIAKNIQGPIVLVIFPDSLGHPVDYGIIEMRKNFL